MKAKSQKVYIFYRKRKKIHVARPLLVLNRFQVLKVCIFWRLPIYVDSTNKLTSFRRNRLRHQIFPLLKVFFNPKIDIALNRFISIVNDENDYFENHLKGIKKFVKTKKFNITNFKKIKNLNWLIFLPKALQRKFYKQLLLSHFKNLTFNEIEFLVKINILLFK